MDWPDIAGRLAGGEDARTAFAHGLADMSGVDRELCTFPVPDCGENLLNAVAHRDHTRSGLTVLFYVFRACAGTAGPAASPSRPALHTTTAGGGPGSPSDTPPSEAAVERGLLIRPVFSRVEPEIANPRHAPARARLPVLSPSRDGSPTASHS